MPSSRETSFLILLACLLFHAVSVEAGCDQLDACSCRDTASGRLISLHALANIGGNASFTVGDPNMPDPHAYLYRYNPCFNLSQTGGVNCRNVALCQTVPIYGNFDLGKQETAVFKETDEGFLTISYVGQQIYESTELRVSTIYLVCDLDGLLESSKFAFVREPTIGNYTFVLTSRCACPGGCSGPFPAVEKVQATAECKPDKDHPCGCRLPENSKLLSVSARKLPNVEVPSQTFVVANTSKIFFNQCANVGVPANACQDSAVCLQTADGDFQDFGQVSSVQFVAEKIGSGVDPNVTVQLTSGDGRRLSRVRLVCDRRHSRSLPPKIIPSKLSATEVVLEAYSECACPGRCEAVDRRVHKTANESAKKSNGK